MANWCVNNLSFTGDLASVLKAVQLFKKMTYDEETNRQPQKPDFLKDGEASLFYFGVSQKGIYFRTPWSPVIDTVRQVAEHFGLDYVHKYEVYGMKLCGEASRHSGAFHQISIDQSDLRGISYNSEHDQFSFEGRLYEDDWTIMVEILDKKRAIRDAALVKSDQNKVPQLSQAELVALRLAGKLPHIEIKYGPFSIRTQAGRQLVACGQQSVYHKVDRGKGWIICICALELSVNQLTWFYSKKKNTEDS